MIKRISFILLFALLVSCFLAAQVESTGKSSDVVVVKKIVHYTNNSRQDPFINLELQFQEKNKVEEAKMEPVPAFEERQKRYPGVRGMLIKELKLQGVIRRPEETVAFFQGVDGKAHFIRVGEDLFNAKVKSISKDVVVFEEYKRYVNKPVEKTLVTVTLHE